MTPLANLTSLDEALPRILEQVSSVEETEVRTLTSALEFLQAKRPLPCYPEQRRAFLPAPAFPKVPTLC